MAAAKLMAKLLKQGRPVGITPDGPKGPAREVKDGVLLIALLSKAPILPLANSVSRKIEFKKSWDKFHVPLPFGRGSLVHGEPLFVRSKGDFESAKKTLQERLDAVTARADELVA